MAEDFVLQWTHNQDYDDDDDETAWSLCSFFVFPNVKFTIDARLIAPLLPPQKKKKKTWRKLRTHLHMVFFRVAAGVPTRSTKR